MTRVLSPCDGCKRRQPEDIPAFPSLARKKNRFSSPHRRQSAHALSFPPDYSRRPSCEKTTLSPNIVSEKPEPKQNSATGQTFPTHPHFQTSSWRTGCGDRNSTWLARTPTGTAISDHSPVKQKMSGASHSAPSCPPQRTSQGPQQGWTNPPDLRVLPAAAPHQTGSHLRLFNQSLAQTCNFQQRRM